MNSYRRILATKPWSKIITDFKSRVTTDGGVIDVIVCNNQFLYGIKKFINRASLIITPAGYKSNKIFAVNPNDGNGDLIWTRATSATRVNENGLIETVTSGTPRINYPIGGGCPSILLEPQRTNLYVSSTPNNTTWSRFQIGVGSLPTITENNAISPDGTNNASLISFNLNGGTTIGDRVWVKNTGTIAVTNGSSYTASFYIKAKNAVDVGKKIKVIAEGLSSSPNLTITLTNNWVRYDFGNVATTTVNYLFQSRGTLGTSDQVDFLLWGVQFEQGSYATSLIPTTTAAVTRNVDTFSLENIYTNGLISASGGSWYVELENNLVMTRDASHTGVYLSSINNPSIGGGGVGDVISFLRTSTAGNRLQIIKQTGLVYTPIYTTLAATIKVLIKWNGSTLDIFVNGSKVVAATAFPATALEYLAANGGDVPKHIKSMLLFPTPLSDTEAIQLTTL